MHDVLPVLMTLIGLIGSLLWREFHDLMPYLAIRLTKIVSKYMLYDNEEVFEIWKADLENIPGKLTKLIWAIGLVRAPINQWREELEVSPLMLILNLSGRSLRFKVITKVFSIDGFSEVESDLANKMYEAGVFNGDRKTRSAAFRKFANEEGFTDVGLKLTRFAYSIQLAYFLINISRGTNGNIDHEIEGKTHKFINPRLREMQCRVHEKNFNNRLFKILTGCTCESHTCTHKH